MRRRSGTPRFAAVELRARLRAARNRAELLRGTLDGEQAVRAAALARDLGAALALVDEVQDRAYTTGLGVGREAGAEAERLGRETSDEGPAW